MWRYVGGERGEKECDAEGVRVPGWLGVVVA